MNTTTNLTSATKGNGSWAQTFSLYRDRRMAKILLLGFVSGLPWLFNYRKCKCNLFACRAAKTQPPSATPR